MILKRYLSEGIAHISYLIADGGQALVIDPRRDIDTYLEDTAQINATINLVLETHRNEDYLTGSCELEAAAGAEIFHADSQWEYPYGNSAEEGQVWSVGRLNIRAIQTPGHTPGSMSYLLHDMDGHPWILFSGDTLFSGDAGRVDLLGADRLVEMAGLLYDSIFNKILSLGDSILLSPAHGAGSVCGSNISERPWTTIGMERKYNPLCQVDSKDAFIKLHAKMHERPPYFRRMEVLNLAGPPILGKSSILRLLSAGELQEADQEVQIVDTRDQISYGAGHIPGSLSMLLRALPNFAGWFLNYESPLVFVCEPAQREIISRIMIRLGFDNLAGYLREGIIEWALAGNKIEKIQMMSVQEFCQFVKQEKNYFLLDVRSEDEFKGSISTRSKHIPLTQLFEHLEEIPKDQPVFPLCRSGNRAMLAASLLYREGWKEIGLLIGGLSAWQSYNCDVVL